MPVNMPTHGHGQGYADINFLIPELIQSVYVRKGPYYADVGDFSSAGSVEIDYLNKLPKNIAEMTFGSFGYQRGLAAGSTAVGAGTLLAAIEGVKYNGPWDVPDNVRKINGVMRYSQGTATDGLTLTAMAYSNAWNSTDQVAQRAIDQGIIGRFGTLDPTDGGVSSRFSLSGNFAHSSEYGQSKLSAYVVRSDLQLYNNFTYFLDNPVNGDQFNQLDRRTLGGFDARHAFDWRFGGLRDANPRRRAEPLRRHPCRPVQDRAARVAFDRARGPRAGRQCRHLDRYAPHAGPTGCAPPSASARTFLPAACSATRRKIPAMRRRRWRARRPASCLARGTRPSSTAMPATACTATTSAARRSRSIPIDKVTPLDRVPLLVRSRGAELGIRTKAIEGLTSSVAVFVLDFDSELLFVGDAGTTEPSRPSRRVGVEWINKYKPVPWLIVRSRRRLYPRPLHRFRSRGRSHPRRAGVDRERRRHLRQRDRLVRRAEGALFRPASADRGRQRPFAVIADLQRPRRLPLRQRPAAAARRAQSLQRADQPDRILLSVALAGRADRRRCRPSCPSR